MLLSQQSRAAWLHQQAAILNPAGLSHCAHAGKYALNMQLQVHYPAAHRHKDTPEGGSLNCCLASMGPCSRLAEQAGCWGRIGALLALLPLLRQLVQPLQVHVRSHRIPLQDPHMLTCTSDGQKSMTAAYSLQKDCCKLHHNLALDLTVWACQRGWAEHVRSWLPMSWKRNTCH